MSNSSLNYTIREIEENDIECGGLLEVLEYLAPVGGLVKPAAKAILKEIKSNPLHRIFVAVVQDGRNQGLIIGTTTLLVEPKFIFGGGRVAHIEDVAVRAEFPEERDWIQACKIRYRASSDNAMRKNSTRLFR